MDTLSEPPTANYFQFLQPYGVLKYFERKDRSSSVKIQALIAVTA
jgi:hypothetical protein